MRRYRRSCASMVSPEGYDGNVYDRGIAEGQAFITLDYVYVVLSVPTASLII